MTNQSFLRSAVRAFCVVIATVPFAMAASAQINFSSSGLSGEGVNNPTSLDFGPDGRLYVSQQNGTIYAYTVERNGPNDYDVIATETINLVKNDVENHDDDGTACSSNCGIRQITGLMVVGTATNPVLYVTSSDSRIAVDSDSGLDTNSGVISRLRCTGSIASNACQAWEHVDIVRGLPRSEENHSTNGMDLDVANNMLYVMSGGHANKGAPGSNFAGTPEYYLSAALLSVDLDIIEQMESNNGGPFTDTRTNTLFVYDLVTLDDPTRTNIDNTHPEFPYESGHPYFNLEIDPGDPFGGNNGFNQAIPVPGGPVQIHSPGYRNAFDVVVTQAGRIYTWDNGPNGGWGGLPLIFDSSDAAKGTGPFNAGAGDYCTNGFNESDSTGHGDALHDATTPGYYGGHPAPIRAFPDKAGLVHYIELGEENWAQDGPVYNFFDRLPAGYGISPADYPDNPVECDYQADDAAKYLDIVSASTNGLDEYKATNFANAMQGDLLVASFNGNVYRCKPDGSGDLVDLDGSESGLGEGNCQVLFGGFGSQPLDVTTQGDGDIFPGTVWAVTYGANNITIFEPNDFQVCNPVNPGDDSDSDGFTNGDEDDNGTDPCNGGSKPDDFDGDLVSDLNDSDDDGDGILDVNDPFALDPMDGLGTTIPVNYPFFNNDPGTGLFGLGFTGLMLDVGGSETWLDLFDPEQLAAGGAPGLMGIEQVTVGDAHQTTNTQDNGFLFGVDADENTPPFIIHSRVLPPYFEIGGNPSTPTGYQSFGIFIGTGDQDNYLKLVVYHGNGSGGIQVAIEDEGVFSEFNYANAVWGEPILDTGSVDLYFVIDPQAGTAMPAISLDGGVNLVDIGSPIALPESWLSSTDDRGLAVGLVSTANGPGSGAPEFGATWDFINIEFGAVTSTGDWLFVDDELNEVRHEGGFVQAGDKFYLLGGRESNAVRIYDPATDSWSTGASSPITLHHFQAVEHDGLIYVVGAMTGSCCAEPEAPNVYIYDPVADTWITGPAMPAGRERGGAGAALHNGKIYLVSGNTNGHQGPVSDLVDVFDPATGEFTPIASIPNPRDHYFATVANNKLYAVGGRTSGTPNIFDGVIAPVDVLDLHTLTWSTLPGSADLNPARAAAPTGLVGNEIIVAGGESSSPTAHSETQALDLATNTWRDLDDMLTPRHATQAIVSNGGFYVAAGSPNQGGPGGNELDLEAFYLFGETEPAVSAINAGTLNAPGSFDFGNAQSPGTAPGSVQLSNVGGNQGIVIESLAVTGDPVFVLDQPWEQPVVLAPGADLDIDLTFSPVSQGAASATLVVTHSGGQTLNIALSGNGLDEPVATYRVNAGGALVAATDSGPDWSADTSANPSAYLATTNGSTGAFAVDNGAHASLPAYVPADLFDSERYHLPAAGDMQWEFPVSAGETYVVRLYVKNGCGCTDTAGDREFDVSIEGENPPTFNDVDPIALWGHGVSGMLEHQVTMTDTTLNIDFSHGPIENPMINAIEILIAGSGGSNVAPQIQPIGTQFSVEGEDIDFTILATDSDGPDNLTFGATGLPTGLSVVDPTNGHVGGIIAAGAAASSPFSVTVTANDGADTAQLTFDWHVTTAGGGTETVLYRVNNGGPQVAATDGGIPWSADQASGQTGGTAASGAASPYVNVPDSGDNAWGTADTVDLSHPSLAGAAAPQALFQVERWDPPTPAPEMEWEFPVPAGTPIAVRLYMAEIYIEDTSDERVFDIEIDGIVPSGLGGINLFDLVGHDAGIMFETITVSDGVVDIDFIHDIENPNVKGIEIVELSGTGGNIAPQIDAIANQVALIDETTAFSFNVVDLDGDALTISTPSTPDASGFTSFVVTENAVGDYTVAVTITPVAADVGSYDFDISAGDGTDTTIESFNLQVNEPASAVVLHRINVGGPQVAAADASAPDWSEDTAANASPFRIGTGGANIFNGDSGVAHPGAIVMAHPSVPASAPAAVFNYERYDVVEAPEMTWALPVVDGTLVEVRLYFAELYEGVTAAGERVFDVQVEGAVPPAFSGIDQFATAGAKGAMMVSTTVSMTDDTLDLVLIHDVENPALKGIEVIQLDAGSNTAPDVTNPGPQANNEGDIVSLPITASDFDGPLALSYSAINLPPDLAIDPSTGVISGTVYGGGGGAFLEIDGLVVIEMESADSIPSDWPLETSVADYTGSGALRYNDANNFGSPGEDVLTYPVQIQNPGTYRFQWRSNVGDTSEGYTEHNDTWLKIEADAFYGQQGGSSIVCPNGAPPENDCTPTTTLEGSSSGGWFKVYRSGSDTWTWVSNTSDNDGHQVYARFDAPGTYNILVSGRSQHHVIDRMVLWKDDYVGSPTATTQPESPRGGPGASDGSPYATEVTVTDGVAPVTVSFDWVINPDPSADQPMAEVSLTPTGGLTASTYTNGSIIIENTSTGNFQIETVSIDLSTGLLPDIVWDPQGTAGDALGKGLVANAGAGTTGYVVPADNTVDPFSLPHNGVDNGEGWDVITLHFTDFDPGETFTFSVDVDPTSIKEATGTGDAGSVSGAELSGASVEVTFSDTSVLSAETFRLAGDDGGSLASIGGGVIPTPVISAPPLALAPTTLSTGHTAAVVPSTDTAQNVLIEGPAGAVVRLFQIEASMLADFGYELEVFEANEALALYEYAAVIEPDGDVEIPVTLYRSDVTNGGFNYFTAVFVQDGRTGPNSNFVILELDSGTPNLAPVAVDDLGVVDAGAAVAIDLLANDSDTDGTLDWSSIVIVDAPLSGTLTLGALGVHTYTHDGLTVDDDSFTYTVTDNDGAVSNLATVTINVLGQPDLPPDVDGDEDPNTTDNDDDNDGLLDTEDPFAIDADNGLTGDLPLSLPMYTTDPGTGLFGLGFTGLMTNGVIGGTQGDDYQDLYSLGSVTVDDDPLNGGVLTLFDVDTGDSWGTGANDQSHAFQVGLNVDSDAEPFVVHSRILEPWFDGTATPQNYASLGMFIGTGDQDNYLKMVFDGADGNVQLALEVDGVNESDENDGSIPLTALAADLYLLIDPVAGTAQAQLSVDGGALVNIGTPIDLPAAWLDPNDDFGLAMGLIATSYGGAPAFDAHFDHLEAYFLAGDDTWNLFEDSPLMALDVLANDHVDPDLFILSIGTPDNGGTAVLNENGTPLDTTDDWIDYTPAADFAGVETFTYTVEDGNGVQSTATVTINLAQVNDAPGATFAGNPAVLEDAGAQVIAAFAVFDAGPGELQANLGFNVLGNDNNALFATQPAIDANGDLSFTPAADANGLATVSVQVQDDGGTDNGGVDTSAVLTFDISVTAVNDQPSVTIGADQLIAENAGAQVMAAFASGFTPGGGADEAGQSIADFIVDNDNNALFSAQPDIANDGSLTYTPAADANGVAVVSVQVQDDGGTADGGIDTSVVQTFSITVTGVNNAPSVTLAGDQGVDEDAGAQVIAAFASGFTPGGGADEAGQSIADFIVGNDNNGLFSAQPDIGNDGTLTYTPAADANGVAVVSVQVQDDGGTADGGVDTSAVQTFSITVNSVNDAPTVTLAGSPVVLEDAGSQLIAGFASGFMPGGGADEAGQSIAGFIVGNDNNALFAAQPAIGTDGALSFTPAANASGVATVSVQVQDDGGTANGGEDTSAVQLFSITVTGVNNAPSVTLAGDQGVDEDAGAQVVAAFASGFTPGGGADEAGQSIADFIVGNDNNALFSAQPDIANDGSLTYTPAADANGVAVVSVQVQDDGGTADGGVDTSAVQTFSITVNSVNDAPTVTLAGDQSVPEGAGETVVAAFASDFAPGGGADEAGQSIADFIVGNDNNALFSAQPDIGNDGSLSYTPAADANGVAVVSVQVQDDGGTPNGGEDTSAIQTFSITVGSVNDAPSVTLSGDQEVNEDAGAQVVAAFASGFTPGGGADEAGQSIADFIVGNDNNALFSAQPDIANDGSLTYTPAADANGVAVVSVQVQDDGGTADGGVDTSAVQTFSITVNSVNDAPTVTLAGDQSVIQAGDAQVIAGFASGFMPGGGADEAGQVAAEYVVSNDNNGLFLVQPAIDASGTLTYTPAALSNGVALVSVQVRDDGGVANSGVDISAVQTFTITVEPELEPPSVTRVHSIASTGDGELAPNESTRTSITQLLVSFSEDVSASGGANAGHYFLYDAGANGGLETAACAAPVGDDTLVSVDSVTWQGTSHTAVLGINGGIPLERGRYFLVACDAIEDDAGNALDGDTNGSAGGHFYLTFLVTHTNQFSNPNFDSGTAGWLADGFVAGSDDADNQATSGGASWTRTGNGAGEGLLIQCVEAADAEHFNIEGLARVGSTAGTAGVEIMVDAFAQPGCVGSVLASELVEGVTGDTGGQWVDFEASGEYPANTRSIQVTFVATGEAGDAATVDLDSLYLDLEHSFIMFKDGFEPLD